MTDRKNHTCRKRKVFEYSFYYNMAQSPYFTVESREDYKEKADKITEEGRRFERLARVMRDPFYLSAERAAEWL